MPTPTDAMLKLGEQAEELGDLSGRLADVSRKLEPVEREYTDFVDNHELGLWNRSEDEDGFKLPSAAIRLKLAHQAMPPELLGRYKGLVESRSRLVQRIRDLKAEIEAQRSILSALKVEMEASGSGMRRAA